MSVPLWPPDVLLLPLFCVLLLDELVMVEFPFMIIELHRSLRFRAANQTNQQRCGSPICGNLLGPCMKTSYQSADDEFKCFNCTSVVVRRRAHSK